MLDHVAKFLVELFTVDLGLKRDKIVKENFYCLILTSICSRSSALRSDSDRELDESFLASKVPL